MRLLVFLITFSFSSVISANSQIEDKIAKFTDCLGRTTLNQSKNEECIKGNYDNNNALLYSGEMVVLLKEFYGNIPDHHKNKILKFLPSHFIKKGLLSRHPEPYRFSEKMRPISFDELTGVSMMASVIPEIGEYVDDIVAYGLQHNWQYWDVPNYEDGKTWFSLLGLTPMLKFKSYLNEESLRKSTIKYPELYPIFSTHHIHQRAFYKMMSKSYKPNLFEVFYFSLASFLSESKENSSSLVMWLFRWKALSHKPYEHKLIQMAERSWKNAMVKRFGNDYEAEIFNLYFDNKDHPFHLIIKEKSLKNVNKDDIIK